MVETHEKKYSPWVLERVAIGDTIRLSWGTTVVGRKSRCAIRLLSTFSSRTHCKFEVAKSGKITVEDFSSNGTFVNSKQYNHQVVKLTDGDRIGIGCEASDGDCESGIYYVYILKRKPMHRSKPLRGENSEKNVGLQSIPKENLSRKEDSVIVEVEPQQPSTSALQSNQECELGINANTTSKNDPCKVLSLKRRKSVRDITNSQGSEKKMDQSTTKSDNMSFPIKNDGYDDVPPPIRRKSSLDPKKSFEKESEADPKMERTEKPSLTRRKSRSELRKPCEVDLNQNKSIEENNETFIAREKSKIDNKKSCEKNSSIDNGIEQINKQLPTRRKSQVFNKQFFERSCETLNSADRNDKLSISGKKIQVDHKFLLDRHSNENADRTDKTSISRKTSQVDHKNSLDRGSNANGDSIDKSSISRKKSQVDIKNSFDKGANANGMDQIAEVSNAENTNIIEKGKSNTCSDKEHDNIHSIPSKNRNEPEKVVRHSSGDKILVRNQEHFDRSACAKKESVGEIPKTCLRRSISEVKGGQGNNSELLVEVSKEDITIESKKSSNDDKNQTVKTILKRIFNCDNESSSKTEKVEMNEVKSMKHENKSSEPVTDHNDVFVISDDEEEDANLDFQLTQSMIHDIKKEFVDLELEESFMEPPTIKEEDDFEGKLMSPIIEIEDDDDDFDECVSQWAMKLSQSTFKEFKPKFDTKENRKIPEIITPPSLPTRKGKLRGVSALSPSKRLILDKTENRTRSIRLKDQCFNKEQELKQKWLEKPTAQRRSEREIKKKIQEERKVKLKEIADQEQAHKRKLQDDDDDVKIVKIPKVKVTYKNRGAFLTEDINVEKASTSASVHSAPITRQQKLMRIPKLSRNSTNEDDALNRRSLTAMDTTTINKNESNDDVEGRDTLAELKIKHRKSRVSIGASSVPIEIQRNLEASEDENNVKKENPKSPRNSSDSLPKASTSYLKDNFVGNSSQMKSILKVAGNVVNKIKKTVRFNEIPKIIYIEVQNESGKTVGQKDASVDLSLFIPVKRKEMPPRIDYSEKILSGILSWSPSWLETRTQEVNNADHVLLPLLHKFASFEDFSRILFPLMRLEFWACIEQDFFHKSSAPYIPLRVESFKSEKRGIYERFVYYCDYVPSSLKDNIPLSLGDLCTLKIETAFKSVCIFAFVEYIKKINLTQKTHYQITLQSNINIHCKELIELQKTIKVRSVSQIRVDLGAFNAVYQLKHSPLLKIILDPNTLINVKEPSVEAVRYKGCDDLNENQKTILLKTYLKCVDQNESNICLIEGPPGTGKSRLITNLALQILYGNEVRNLDKKILICSQSNTAIDVIVLKLLRIRSKMRSRKFRLARFGILERMHPKARSVSVQTLIGNYLRPKDQGIHDTLKQERMILEAKITALNHVNANGANNISHDELQKLKQRLEMINRIQNQQVTVEMEKSLYHERIQGAHIVCTTLSSCIKLLQYTNYFDICIIDEATQCLEPWTLIPLQFGISSLVLVGDTQQLPGTVLSKTAAEYGLGESLFTRIQKCLQMEKYNPILSLRTQYRMHPEICRWPNSYFYKKQLISDPSTSDSKLLVKPYVVFDLDYSQNENGGNGQISNTLEAKFVADLIHHMSAILPTKEYAYGVITPYAQHRESLNIKLREAGINEVLVNTIDSYQGKEKDVIIMSNARTKGIGFLNNCQRLNVAMTRARKCLILCGNFAALMRVPVWKSLLEDAKQRGVFYHIKRSEALDFDKNVMRYIKV